MEIHQLRYFLAVIQAGSFTAAAKACAVSQPSLSAQIAKLEGNWAGLCWSAGGRGQGLRPGASFSAAGLGGFAPDWKAAAWSGRALRPEARQREPGLACPLQAPTCSLRPEGLGQGPSRNQA